MVPWFVADYESSGPLVARSAPIRRALEVADRAAQANLPVLLLGETGSGKEVFARRIHDRSPRVRAPLTSVNCGALPQHLVESSLFGHEQGAFTGADRCNLGIFEVASGGTVFLDEVGELPLGAQAALLRVLETQKVTRVGGTRELAVDVRVVAATHRDLSSMCRSGAFRWDLFFRLNVLTLELPPLRERREDIAPLATRFLSAALPSHRRLRGFDEEAVEALMVYSWPGNVRELKNAVERAVVVSDGDLIARRDLPPVIADFDVADGAGIQALFDEDSTDGLDFKEQMRRCEVEVIIRALERAAGNRTRAAGLLAMPRRTLVHKIKVLGIREILEERRRRREGHASSASEERCAHPERRS